MVVEKARGGIEMNDLQKVSCVVLLGFGILLFHPMDLTNIVSAVLMVFPSILLGKEVLRYELEKGELK